MSILTEWPREAYDDRAFGGFDAAAADFSLGNARAMAWASKLAYETGNPAMMREIAAAWGFAVLEPFATAAAGGGRLGEPDTRGFVAAGRHATLLAFAGTDPLLLPNWITNLDIRKTGDNGQRIHAGFKRAAEAVRPFVESALARHHDGVRPLFVTGHSLGAALALLSALWLETGRRPALALRAVYAVGMPRVGDAGFAAACGAQLGSRLFRLVHGGDIVTGVPLAADSYRHVGRLLHCPSGGRFAAAPPPDDWSSNEPDLARALIGRLLSDVPAAPAVPWPASAEGLRGFLLRKLIDVIPSVLRDHLPDRYIAACAPE